MKRLYQKIYLTIVGSLIAVVLVSGAIWRSGADEPPWGAGFEVAGDIVAAILPPPDAPRAAQQVAIERLSERLRMDLSLFDASLRPLAAAGRPLPPPSRRRAGWLPGSGPPAWAVPLPDGRWIVAGAPPRHRNPFARMIFFLGAIAVVVALCAYPFVRGLTRRLERLQAGVETLGAGNLSARVKVEGRDEVARLAESFNRAAARIEELVGAHRLLLANASHELRTPLSRIRLGLELFEKDGDPRRKEELARDIGELDQLLDEILLASRLDANPVLERERVDLLALAAEEAAREGDSEVAGDAVAVDGDPRLLRRLVRNLLDNARRHGKPPIRIDVRHDGAQAILEVTDAGPGIPPEEREKVFAPFHRLGTESTGAGLGLSLCRQIARLHGGEVAVHPRPEAQSCFSVRLPLAA